MARDAIDAVKKGGTRDDDVNPLSQTDMPGCGVITALIMLSAASVAPPDARLIEHLLLRKEYCTVTVDGCSDQEGRQIRFNTRYAVSNVVCEQLGKSEPGTGSWRCGFDVRETRWMEGAQIGEEQYDRRTEIFDLTSFTVHDGKREIPSLLWSQRPLEESR